jgi:dihydrofolate reductase
MSMHGRKVVLYIASSLDGYISKPNDDLSFLSIVEREGQDYGYHDFIETTDTVIMGRKTYEWIMSQVSVFPHADKDTYVITRSSKSDQGNIKFYSGNLYDLVLKLKQEKGKDIFIDGGAEIVNALLKYSLIDEFYISIIPVLLGSGVRLFNGAIPEQQLKLLKSKQFDTGLVQLHYKLTSNIIG